jgi:predicted secreted protein
MKILLLNMQNTQHITETQAIKIAKSMLKQGFTISYLNANEVEDFIWGYLYEHGLQYSKPIFYVDQFNNQSAAIVYQEN